MASIDPSGARTPQRRSAAVRYVPVAAVGFAILVLAMVVVSRTGEPPPSPTGVGSVVLRMGGVRTSVYAGGAPQFSASARSVRIVPLRAIGPFRFGFLDAVVASDAKIDLFADVSAEPARGLRVADAASALIHASRLSALAGAELTPLTVTRRSAEGASLLLTAQRCWAGLGGVLTCRKGRLRQGDELTPFTQATHDGRRWRITAPVRR